MMTEAIQKLIKLTGHQFVELTSRGNTAIFCTLFIAKQFGINKICIPDQGGWFTFKTYPKLLDMEIVVLETDNGIIKPATIPVSEDTALLYAQPTGYFAAQDMKALYQHCNSKTLVIVDVSGSIGDEELCDGEFADIMVGSFSEWKPINIGYGGFLSVKEKKIFDLGKDILSINKVPSTLEKELEKKLTVLSERYKLFYETTKRIKKDLTLYNILHPEKKGINVVIAYQNEKEKKEITDYCNKNKFEYTQCPRYIRVKAQAISIEVKRL